VVEFQPSPSPLRPVPINLLLGCISMRHGASVINEMARRNT